MQAEQKHIVLLIIIFLWSCVSVRANEVVVAFVNGAPQGILWHDKDNWTMYVSPYMVVNSDRFTKHYYAGSQRIASKIGAGEFDNLYDASKACVTAGQKDYAERLNQITETRNDYYAALGIPPGPPTAKGIYGEAEYSGMYGEYVIEPLGDYSVPTGWPMKPYKRPYGGTPGAPVMYEKPSDPEDEGAGYGYSNAEGLEENDIYFYHSDHLGSTSYITDKDGNATQFVSYKPYGEALVDEHNTSYEQPWKFNGKELDSVTGLYYYGARYYEPVLALWYGVDALAEKYPNMSPYNYCVGNPVKFVDPDGREKLVVVGNEGEGPTADFKDNGEYRYGEGRRYFLQAGLNRAKEYKKKAGNEQVTMMVYEGQYSKDELDLYKAEAEKSSINFMTVSDDADIADYVNKKTTWSLSSSDRASDLISDFTYFGHGHPDDMAVGYRTVFDGVERLDGSEFSPNSFTTNANFALVSCRSGLGALLQNVSKLTNGNIHVYNVRVQWGQSSMGKNAQYGLDYYCPFNLHPDDRSIIVPSNKRDAIVKGHRK